MMAKGPAGVLRSTNDWLFHVRLRPAMEAFIIALALAALAGCGATAPAATHTPPSPAFAEPALSPPAALTPAATHTPPSPVFVEPTLSPPAALTPAGDYGFSIHLLARDLPPQQLAILSHLELEKDPLLSVSDIASYNKATHEIELTAAGYEKIHALSVPLDGKAFAVCVGGQPVYAGAFWVAYSSVSFDGIVIDVSRATEENPVLQIQLGYPGPAFFHGDDPRSDPRVLQALEQAGKLK